MLERFTFERRRPTSTHSYKKEEDCNRMAVRKHRPASPRSGFVQDTPVGRISAFERSAFNCFRTLIRDWF